LKLHFIEKIANKDKMRKTMTYFKILLLGSGGREHALCYKLSQSPKVTKIYCATGNAGIAEYAQLVALNITNPTEILTFCQEKEINFVIIGSEAPAASGVTDLLLLHHIKVFGCSQKASMLEASKGFTKDLCQKLNVPTARYIRANNYDDSLKALTLCYQSRWFSSR
jgi:phosphoribosylamine---glycine ligase